MKKPHLRLVTDEQFDPTEEELQKLERTRVEKLPLCAKCRARPRAKIGQTARVGLPEMFDQVSSIHKDPKSWEALSRQEVQKLFLVHRHLCQASKGRYCATCLESSVQFASDFIRSVKKEAP